MLTPRRRLRRPLLGGLILLGLLGLASPQSEPPPPDPSKPHHGPDGRFRNPRLQTGQRTGAFFRWKLGLGEKDPVVQVPEDFVFPNAMERARNPGPTVTWVNHSTFLVSAGGLNVLTDPIWSDRCSPVQWVGPKRRHPPGVAFEDLPRIDHVFVSHSHYDHLDADTVKAIGDGPTWWVPLRLGAWFREQGITRVVEMDWWDSREVPGPEGGTMRITSVPVQHFSGRTPFDHNETLWSGWVVRIGKRQFYFAGDTGYNTRDFRDARRRLGPMDLALIPIGAYNPRWFMKQMHVNPEEAVRIHEDLGARLSIAMHWKTFKLTDEPPREPPYRLFLALKARGIPTDRFRVLEPGQRISW
jgi:N-acyl-phosphatidylethanolamine-hydrolysing phospholipase D